MNEVLGFLSASTQVLVAVGVLLLLYRASHLVDRISANLEEKRR